MLHDIWTVFRKEWQELLDMTSGRSAMIRLLIWVAIFGVMFPLESGGAWLFTITPVIFWSWMAFFYVSSLSVSTIAGERERHTLETLLATRLPDAAILLGKVLASVAYGWGLVMITYITAVVAINVAARGTGSGLQFYTPAVAIGGVLMSLFAALLVAGLGVLISLRASSTRQAQMTLYIVSVVMFLPLVLSQSMPAIQAWANRLVLSANTASFVLVGSLILLAGAAVTVGAALVRFRRSELILD